MSYTKKISEYWKFEVIEKRKKAIGKHITYDHTFHEDSKSSHSQIKEQKENVRSSIISGISLDPALSQVDIEKYSLIPLEFQDGDVSKLLDTVDLSSILHDPNVRKHIELPPIGNLKSRIIHPSQYTDKIYDGSQPFHKVLQANQSQKIHFCNEHPRTTLNPEQKKLLQEQLQNCDNVKELVSKLGILVTPEFFKTDRVTIHSNLTTDKKKLLQKENPEFIDEYQNYSGGQYKNYSNGLYTAAIECLKLDEEAKIVEDKEMLKKENEKRKKLGKPLKTKKFKKTAAFSPLSIFMKMTDISQYIRKYGIPKKKNTFPNLLEFLESSLREESIRNRFYLFYDLFLRAGYNGLYFITQNQIDTHASNMSLFELNPHISPTTCEFGKGMLNLKEQTALSIISYRLKSMIEEAKKISNHEIISSIFEKKKWSADNLPDKYKVDLAKYQEFFLGRAYRYILNYIGGQLKYLSKYFSKTGGVISLMKDPFARFSIYLEIQYLLSFFREKMRAVFIRAKNKKKDIKGGMSLILKRLAFMFWQPENSTKNDFFQFLKTKLKDTINLLKNSDTTKTLKKLLNEWYKADPENLLHHLYVYTNNPEESIIARSAKSRQFLETHIFSNKEVIDEIYNYYHVLVQLRFFFRSHQFNLSPVEADFAFPQEKLDNLNLVERLNIKKREIGSPKIGIGGMKLIYRTYKTSLSVPESLRKGNTIHSIKEPSLDLSKMEITDLMMRQQILRYLQPERRKTYNKKRKKQGTNELKSGFKGFAELYNLKKTSEKYNEYLDIYEHHKTRSVNTELQRVSNRISEITKKKGRTRLVKPSLSEISSIPEISDLHNPKSSEILINDYVRLAAESVKRMARHSNIICIEDCHLDIPWNKQERKRIIIEEEPSLNSKAEGRLGIEYFSKKGGRKNTSQYESRNGFIFFAQALNAAHGLQGKLELAYKLLFSQGNTQAKNRLMVSYTVPKYFRVALAKHWKSDQNWTGDMIHSFRRKLDSEMPEGLQLNNINQYFRTLASEILEFVPESDFKKERKLVRWFQKNHALHLLFLDHDIHHSVSTRTKAKFQKETYEHLRKVILWYEIELSQEIKRKITAFNPSRITNAAKKFLKSLDRVKNSSEPYKECVKHFTDTNFIREYAYYWENCIPGVKYAAFFKRLLKGHPEINQNYVISVVTGIISYAYADEYPNAESVFKQSFTKETCITKPFQSKKRKKTMVPLNLYETRKGIIRIKDPNANRSPNENQNTYPDIENAWLENQPVFLGVPLIYDEWLEESEKVDRDHPHPLICSRQGKTVRYLYFELRATDKMIECIQTGAKIETMRVLPPRGPSRKMEVEVVLYAPYAACFQHEHKFIKKWDEKHSNFREQLENIKDPNTLGTDFNIQGQYILAVSTAGTQIDLTERLAKWEQVHDHLEYLRTQLIPRLHKKIKNTGPQNPKVGKYKSELGLLYRKRGTLNREYKRMAIMVLLYIICKLKPNEIGWDGIRNIKPKNKKMKSIINYLPQNQNLFQMFEEWIKDLKTSKIVPQNTKIIISNPHTSRYCPNCLNEAIKNNEKLKNAATKKYQENGKNIPYRDFLCRNCEYEKIGGRDATAAQVCAILTKNRRKIEDKQLM